MTNKGTKTPYVKCIGNSATEVTGSCYLVRFKKYCLLLDCGLTQGHDIATDYKANVAMLKKIKVKEIDYIVLSHNHVDHSGLLPALYARGCQAHIYAPLGSAKFLRLLWEDSMKIFTQDCQKLMSKGTKATPFYTQEDIERTLARIIEVPWHKSHQKMVFPYHINQDIVLQYYAANHIVCACQVYLEFCDGSVRHRLGFTGDIGGDKSQPYVDDRATLPYVNVLLGESTYSAPGRINKPYDRPLDLDKIVTVVQDSNIVLIPCFSLGRTQLILHELKHLWGKGLLPQDIKIIVDSPLAQKFCNIWEDSDQFFDWANVHFVDSWVESQELQRTANHCIVISASGMMTGGRVVEWIKTVLPNPKNTILFCGYSGDNTLASQIRYGNSTINVDGILVSNEANIVELVSFSSHANYEELCGYYLGDCKYDKLILVHGNMDNKVNFAHCLQENLVKQGKSSRVICANEDTKVSF